MVKKPKFRPRITRVKLNPEQAVLQCTCYDLNIVAGYSAMGYWNSGNIVAGPWCVSLQRGKASQYDSGFSILCVTGLGGSNTSSS